MGDGVIVDVSECNRCGGELTDGACLRCGNQASFRAVHRDLILLLLLCTIAIATFVFTRFVAGMNERAEARVGDIWFQQGEQELADHRYEPAIESFRKARARDRDKREYVLALASALQFANHNDEARQALLHIREVAPENAEINLSLARLAAKRQDVTEALRYYHNALYGLWTGSRVDQQRRDVRIELVNFLLDHQQRSMALSELLVLDTELPEEVKAYDDAGDLFLRAGDSAHALKDFGRALHLGRSDFRALAGAGQAASDSQEYGLARRYLQRAATLEPHDTTVEHQLSLVNMTFSRDPLLPRISQEERVRRATEDYNHALSTLQACVSKQHTAQNSNAALDPLYAEAVEFQDELQPKNVKENPDTVRDAVDLVFRMESAMHGTCTPLQQVDEALLRIGRKHMGALQ